MTYSLTEQEDMLKRAAYGFSNRLDAMKKMITKISDKDFLPNDEFIAHLETIPESTQAEFMRAMIVMEFIFLSDDGVKIMPALVNYTNSMLIPFEFPFAPRC